jgi:hypothetical protein
MFEVYRVAPLPTATDSRKKGRPSQDRPPSFPEQPPQFMVKYFTFG